MSSLKGIVARCPRLVQAEVVLALAAVLLSFVAGMTGWVALLALAFGLLALAACCAVWMYCRLLLDGLRETRSVPGGAAPELVALVARLAANAGLEPPRIRVVRAEQPNAHIRSLQGPPRITVTHGLLERCTELERTGVLGHELGHISAGHDRFYRRRFVPAYAATSGVIVITGALAAPWFGVLSVLWPAAACVGAAVAWRLHVPATRRRELDADRLGAWITGVEAPRASLDAAARERKTPVRKGPLSALLRLLDPYPTLAERRAAIESEALAPRNDGQGATGRPSPNGDSPTTAGNAPARVRSA
ncbi:MAG: M48 family metallopeptidase [Solirubrobacteraceae bacterium]